MGRAALAALVTMAAGGCASGDEASALDRVVTYINSSPGLLVSTPSGGGALGVRGQRERAEQELNGRAWPLGTRFP